MFRIFRAFTAAFQTFSTDKGRVPRGSRLVEEKSLVRPQRRPMRVKIKMLCVYRYYSVRQCRIVTIPFGYRKHDAPSSVTAPASRTAPERSGGDAS
jgi:hypothetical protein